MARQATNGYTLNAFWDRFIVDIEVTLTTHKLLRHFILHGTLC